MLWCYGRSGDKRMLDMAQNTWDKYTKDAEAEYQAAQQQSASGAAAGRRRFSRHADLAPSRVFSNTPAQSHGVSYSEISKQPAILYLYTGNEDYRKFAVAAQKRVFDYHMLIDGIPSSSEGYAGTTALDEHETCDITDHAWNWTYALQATGDGQYGDAIERAMLQCASGSDQARLDGYSILWKPQSGAREFEL